MVKKLGKLVLVLLLVIAAIGAWIFLGSATGFSGPKEYLYIRAESATKKAVLDSLASNRIVTNQTAFSFLADRMGYWQNIRPGKYEVKKGTSLLSLVRMLRNGRQTPVSLVITKLRTPEDFARFTGNRFAFDSSQMMSFLTTADSLRRFEATPEKALWVVIPDSYQLFWNSTPGTVYAKLHGEAEKFWTPERRRKASALGLTQADVYTLASIIEEETTNHNEKDTIASVYLNRLKKGMPLQADPTVKYAVRNFALKRIAGDILHSTSPYNTYRYKGLPPGPICTPSRRTIDAVLNPATTNFLYFVANRNLNGHLFSETFEEHVQKANAYREQDRERRQRDSLKKA